MGVGVPWGPPGEALLSFLGHFHAMASPSGMHAPTTLPVYADHFLIAINGPTEGEGNAPVAAASALSEVDGEGNIHIDVGKQRKETRKKKETRKNTTKVVAA